MKTKRLLAFLLIAVFVIGVMPLTVAAASSDPVCGKIEHQHDDTCYELTCGLEEHTHDAPGKNSKCYHICTNIRHYFLGKHIRGTKCVKVSEPIIIFGKVVGHIDIYYSLSCGRVDHTHDPSKPGECYELTCEREEHTHGDECFGPEMFSYTINYEFFLNGGSVGTDSDTGFALLGEVITVPGTKNFEGVTFTLGGDQDTSLTVGEGENVLTVNYYATSGGGENPTPIPEVTPTYIPPQVIIPTTPTPEPEIELPEEEIPADVPEVEEEEQFEDEEIPTNVPTTGDASPIFPAIALIALAGAAFALTFKKSRKNG